MPEIMEQKKTAKPGDGEFVGTAEAARILGMSKATLENYRTNKRCQDLGPSFVRVGGWRVLYSVSELERYIEGKKDGTYVRTEEVDA